MTEWNVETAPDLLAVCADLVEMSDAGAPCPPRLVVMARAAVAKARGEQESMAVPPTRNLREKWNGGEP